MKQCTQCGTLKPLNEFSKDKYKRDGHRSACKICNKKDHLRRYTVDPESNRLRSQEYRKRLRETNPEKLILANRRTKLKRAYGLSLEDYQNMYDKQNGKCACCRKEQKKLVVDHNHTTNKVRELLCNQCNTALGLLNENIDVMHSLIEYTRRHNSEI